MPPYLTMFYLFCTIGYNTCVHSIIIPANLIIFNYDLYEILLIIFFLSSQLIIISQELHVIDGIPQLIFVQSSYTIEVCSSHAFRLYFAQVWHQET